MKYVETQPQETGFYWFRGEDRSGENEFIVEFNADLYEVRDGDRWVDIGTFEALWDNPTWSEVIETPD